MPTYDYECRSCGHNFETFQSMSDDTLTTCPECKENHLRRLIGGGSGLIFKGSGFYVNDSRSSNTPSSESKKTGSQPPNNASSDSGKSSSTGKASA